MNVADMRSLIENVPDDYEIYVSHFYNERPINNGNWGVLGCISKVHHDSKKIELVISHTFILGGLVNFNDTKAMEELVNGNQAK